MESATPGVPTLNPVNPVVAAVREVPVRGSDGAAAWDTVMAPGCGQPAGLGARHVSAAGAPERGVLPAPGRALSRRSPVFALPDGYQF